MFQNHCRVKILFYFSFEERERENDCRIEDVSLCVDEICLVTVKIDRCPFFIPFRILSQPCLSIFEIVPLRYSGKKSKVQRNVRARYLDIDESVGGYTYLSVLRINKVWSSYRSARMSVSSDAACTRLNLVSQWWFSVSPCSSANRNTTLEGRLE